MATLTRRSSLRCPACGHEEELEMPTDAGVFFHACARCSVLFWPAAGDC